ncbi:MAG: hypothetical protein JJT82_09195 [Legionellaceae bacterium]|nr:hypothetical protein [Legionellaceae bacterium]
MTLNSTLIVLLLLSSLMPAVMIFCLQEHQHRRRTWINMTGASIKLVLLALMIWGWLGGQNYEFRLQLLPKLELLLRLDALSVLFASLSALLWFLTTIYAVGYLKHTAHQVRFFGFFSLCVNATVGISLAGNLITFLIFYELLTLSTYPLVVHRGTRESHQAGRLYLIYTMTGGAALTLGIAWLMSLAGPLEFTSGGALASVAEQHAQSLRMIFVLSVAGLGVKASLVPLHGWLPRAMVAPAPVSALLHAVAVVKAGAFGIVRLVYNVYGVELASQLGLMSGLAIVAAITIVYGSMVAAFQNDIKRLLAYSTVSQVSYITLGVAIFGPLASIGGLIHLVNQGLMKITLFFCAGSFATTLGIHRVDELDGVGQRMPWTMAAFTVGALGMIGLPPLAGFISKWYLATGALLEGHAWVVVVLIVSSLLNMIYFLPLLYAGWFKAHKAPWPGPERPMSQAVHGMLLAPALVTGLLVILIGVFASAPFMPLEWARLLVFLEYPR